MTHLDILLAYIIPCPYTLLQLLPNSKCNRAKGRR